MSPLPGTETAGRRHVLVVADVFPWPARDGYRLRLASMLQGLARSGSVDLFVAAQEGDPTSGPVPGYIRRYDVSVARPSVQTLLLLARTLRDPLPRRVLWRDWSPAQRALASFTAGRSYDVTWFSHLDSYLALGGDDPDRSIVDCDNLEDRALLGRPSARSILAGAVRPGGRTPALKHLVRLALDARDRRCWAAVQATTAAQVAAIVVCSELDRRRLAHSRAAVLPNTYAPPAVVLPPLPQEPTVVMVARFTYEPNIAGVAWFVRQVLPEVIPRVPGVEVRLVGRYDRRLEEVARAPGITVVGEVDDVGDELQRARAVIVPLLSGSGTRVKALEALAYGRPLVSTILGAEGLGLVDGVHGLIVDDAHEFAGALGRVLTDDALAHRLVESGGRLLRERFDPQRVWSDVARLVDRICSESDPDSERRCVGQA